MSLRIPGGKTDEEKFEEAWKYIDRLLLTFPDYADFSLSEIIEKVGKDRTEIREIATCSQQIDSILKDLDYISVHPTLNQRRKMTPNGRKAKVAGGHEAYEKKLEEKEKQTPTIVVTGNNNAVANNQSSFDKSFNPDQSSKTEPTKSKITVESILKVTAAIIGLILVVLKACGKV